MSDLEHTFALPLWAIVDESKVEPGKSDTRMLARQLGRWFSHNFNITHKGTTIEVGPDGPIFVIAGIAEAHWPAMIALAQAQACTLYLVLPTPDGNFQLKPLEGPPLP